MIQGRTCSCGAVAAGDAWACEKRGSDDRDHVLALPMPDWSVDGDSEQPFVRYRRMLRSWVEAEDDGWFVDRVDNSTQRLQKWTGTASRSRLVRTPSSTIG